MHPGPAGEALRGLASPHKVPRVELNGLGYSLSNPHSFWPSPETKRNPTWELQTLRRAQFPERDSHPYTTKLTWYQLSQVWQNLSQTAQSVQEPLSVQGTLDALRVRRQNQIRPDHLNLTENPSPVRPDPGGVGQRNDGDLWAEGSGARVATATGWDPNQLMAGTPWDI